MRTTPHQVNFRDESSLYNTQTKRISNSNKISMPDILNISLQKIKPSTIDPDEFISSDIVDDITFRLAFANLQKEILLGHQAILNGRTTTLADVIKELNPE